MISRFFIDRPIFANVLAIVTVLFGAVALYRLPVERYPAITPPTVVVSTNYPGATAQVQVQNLMSIAEPGLPEEVRRQGVTVKKQSSNIVLAVSLTSPDQSLN